MVVVIVVIVVMVVIVVVGVVSVIVVVIVVIVAMGIVIVVVVSMLIPVVVASAVGFIRHTIAVAGVESNIGSKRCPCHQKNISSRCSLIVVVMVIRIGY